jgi:hypothetical protein
VAGGVEDVLYQYNWMQADLRDVTISLASRVE